MLGETYFKLDLERLTLVSDWTKDEIQNQMEDSGVTIGTCRLQTTN